MNLKQKGLVKLANLNPHFRESLNVNYLSLLADIENEQEFSTYYAKVEDYIKSLIAKDTEYEKLIKIRSIISYKKALISKMSKR